MYASCELDNFIVIKYKDLVFIIALMVNSIKDTGKIIKWMDMESFTGQMEESLKISYLDIMDIFWMIKDMAKGNKFCQMEKDLKYKFYI